MTVDGKKKIVGGGLIAKSLEDITFNKSTLILASGVSNSKETRGSEFQRETELILREISNHPKYDVIYFSTCSLDSDTSTLYTKHKLQMELLVREYSASFHIFRLPQVVGLVFNSTLVSFFVNSILKNKVLNIESYAKRNLLDVLDVSRIVEVLVNYELSTNSIHNIASINNLPVIEIVNEISILLDHTVNVVQMPSGNNQSVNIDFLRGALDSNDIIFKDDYWRLVLKKYVPLYLDYFNRTST
jgi:hypothetical protein